MQHQKRVEFHELQDKTVGLTILNDCGEDCSLRTEEIINRPFYVTIVWPLQSRRKRLSK